MLTCNEQVLQFKKNCTYSDAVIEQFYGAEGYDVYNPTVPFNLDGKLIMGCRVEKRDHEFSETMFYEKREQAWYLIEGVSLPRLQDPSVAFVDDEIVIGGIEYPVKTLYKGKVYEEGWIQQFYKGKDLYSLKKFFTGPAQMKDIRLCQLSDGRVVFFTHPLDRKWIGVAIFDNLSDVTPEALEDAEVFPGHILDGEWGGANQVLELRGGIIGIIGHKSFMTAEQDEPMLHYNSVALTYDVNTGTASYPKIIATRSMFPPTESKWRKVEDVLFTSGIIREGSKARLYTGISDCCIGSVLIDYPF